MMEEEGWPSRWAELRGDEGLTSKHWRTRLAALQSLLLFADQYPSMDRAILTELLDLLLFSLALTDTHALVRKTAAESAGKVLSLIHDHLSAAQLDQYVLGLFALNSDTELEVQRAAADALSSSCMMLGSQWLEGMIPRFMHQFVSTALHSLNVSERTSKATYFGGVGTSFDMSFTIPALEGIIRLGHSKSTPVRKVVNLEIAPHLVLLLVAVSASLLEECEKFRDRTGASQVSSLLRVLGSSKYRQHVIFMISNHLHEGMALARWHKIPAFVGEELAGLLEKVDAVVILKGIFVAVESRIDMSDGFYIGSTYADRENVQVGALHHIIKNLRIPPALVVALPETHDKMSEGKFVKHSYYYLKIADALIRDTSADMLNGNIVQEFVLTCSVLASRDDKNLLWLTMDIQKLSNGIMELLGAILTEDQQQAQTAKVIASVSTGVERLLLLILPQLISNFKSSLRDHLTEINDVNHETNSSTVNLANAIVASLQLYWCSKQILHPHLSQICTIIMPCALMALDHYSPNVKRQGLKLFIHLTENLNPSELRWYKDAVLLCVMRNIVGCGELWPLIVRTAIPLVVCIEGKNPRSKWYRNVLNEMLTELERHQLDAAYFKVWVENVQQLFEAMGLVLVAHLKRLLPLLFVWLHSADDSSVLLVVNLLKVIVKQTWPRMPFHVERLGNELSMVYKESFDKKEGVGIRSSVIEVAVLLQMCGGPAFGQKWLTDVGDPDCLASALSHHLSGQTAKLQVS